MICKNCGTEYSTKFCPDCGAAADEAESTTVSELKPEQPKKKNNKVIIIVLAVIICAALVVIGVCVYNMVSDKKGSGDPEKPTPSHTVDNDSFDLSEIDDETLRDLAKKGLLKKHIDYMSADEIDEMIKAVFGADYEDVTAEEFVDAFEPAFKKYDKNYDRDEKIEFVQEEYDEYGLIYCIGQKGNYTVCIAYDDYDYMYDDGYINDGIVYNKKTGKLFLIDGYSEEYSSEPFRITEYMGTDTEFETYVYSSDYSAAGGYFLDENSYSDGIYDAEGNLLVVEADDKFYDSKLNPIEEDEYEKIVDELVESMSSN